MSAPTDTCADCGHRRVQHGFPQVESGRPIVGCRACACPAFDEGAPKPATPVLKPGYRSMTTDEQCLAASLYACSFTPASFDKRFARDVWTLARSPPRSAAPAPIA